MDKPAAEPVYSVSELNRAARLLLEKGGIVPLYNQVFPMAAANAVLGIMSNTTS